MAVGVGVGRLPASGDGAVRDGRVVDRPQRAQLGKQHLLEQVSVVVHLRRLLVVVARVVEHQLKVVDALVHRHVLQHGAGSDGQRR